MAAFGRIKDYHLKLLIVITLLSSSNAFAEDKWAPVSRAKLPENSKIYQIVDALNLELNGNDPIYLFELGKLLNDSTKSAFLDSISALKSEINSGVERGRYRRLVLQINSVTSNANSAAAKVEAFLEQNDFVISRKFDLVLKNNGLREQIENPAQLLSELGKLLDDSDDLLWSSGESKTPPSPTKLSGTRNQYSPNLFVPRIFYQLGKFVAPRFTVQKSIEKWGHWIFGATFDMEALEYQDVIPSFCHQYFFVTDPNWNRIVGADYRQNHLGVTGSYGSGSLNFKQPMGITHIYPDGYVVADYYNNRAVVYNLNYNGTLSYYGELKNGYNGVIDVASALFAPDDSYGENPLGQELAVLDKENGRVDIYSADYSIPGVRLKTLFSHGSGAGQLDDPTAICYGRGYALGYNSHCIYVADNGNHRIVREKTRSTDPNIYAVSNFEFLPRAELSSIDVDAYGYVYVVDRYNCFVYLFTPDLSEMIAYFGGRGSADGQLFWPNKIKFGDSWSIDGGGTIRPNVIGDAFISEHFWDSTGIRRFALGCDAEAEMMRYYFKPCSSCVDYLSFNWWQDGYATAYIKIFKDNVLKDSIESPRRILGDNDHFWAIPDNLGNGWYKYQIRLVSIFGSTDVTIKDSLFVIRSVDICGTCTIRCQDLFVLDSSECNEASPYNYCIYADMDKWYTVVYKATDLYHRAMTYTYISPYFKLYPDTVGSSGSYSLTTTKDTIFFKCYPYPDGWVNHMQAKLLRVYTNVGCWKGDPPDFDTIASEGRDTALDCGVFQLYPYFHFNECSTPCCQIPGCCDCNGGCPMLYSFDGSQYKLENNLLPQSEKLSGESTHVTDYYPVFFARESDAHECSFKIREDEHEISSLDQFELLAYDVPANSGNIMLDNRNAPVSVWAGKNYLRKAVSNKGEDILPLLTANDSLVFSSDGHGYLDAEYLLPQYSPIRGPVEGQTWGAIYPGFPDKGVYKINTEDSAVNEPNLYILHAKDREESYQAVDTLYPRVNGLEVPVNLSDYIIDGILSIRLEWTNGISLNYLPYTQLRNIDAKQVRIPLVKASHSVLGEVTSLLADSSGPPVTLKPGENIELTFKAEPKNQGTKRLLLVKTTGRYKRFSPANVAAAPLPKEFEFGQNYPNPFNPSTSFKFALPAECQVRLEIFNILGQKVATVLDRWKEAGRHEVVWNGLSDSGEPVASGVYFATFKAGDFSSTRKVVVVK